MELGTWLETNGLGNYASVFAENEIDFDVLSQLTEDDLEKLGLSVGARRRLALAVQSLEAGLSPPTKKSVSGSSQAERRQLTVMFCDLVGSTGLSQELDPEALRELLRAYQQVCGQVVARYEGHVAQYLGDGLMVYFGWPRAHEDDAERAIRSGLEIVEAIKKVQAPEPLQVRIGIATGPVVVGETGAGDASVPKIAVGETPNLAARIQGLAQADQILIGPDTLKLVGATFELGDAGEHTLKGIVEPVQSWRVNGLAKAEGRFEAAHGESGLTPLVGREEELEVLLRRWDRARGGQGQVVLLSGEPGIGKSRITRALRDMIGDEKHTRLRYQCSPFHTQSALYPVIEQFEHAAGFEKDDSADKKLDKFEQLLGKTLSGAELQNVAPLFAALLSLPGKRYAPIHVAPQRQKELTLEALINQVARFAAESPVLMVFEDVHWVDPTTQEVLDLMVERIVELPVFLLITYRPEYVSPHWSADAHVTELHLNRLNRQLGSELAANVTGGKVLPADVLEQIVEKTDGVPLFVEELTKTVLESGLMADAGDHYELAGPLPPLAIPSSLQDSLMARLDRLAEVREVAQVGACIGREFSYQLIAAVSTFGEDKLRIALEQLKAAELLFQRGTVPNSAYTFKHALLQGAAYASLLKSKRQVLNKAIAETLENRFADRTRNAPEVVAHHYTEAGLFDQATDYWLKAAQREMERFANAEAVGHASKGLELLKSLPENIERDRKELLLQTVLGTALGVSKGYTPPEVGEAFERAYVLSEKVGDTPARFMMLQGLWTYYLMRARYSISREIADRIMALATDAAEPGALVLAHLCTGINAYFPGDLAQALSHTKAARELYEKDGARSLAPVYGYDPGVMSFEFNAWALLEAGYPDQAAAMFVTGFDYAEKHGHPLTVATMKVHAACADASSDDPHRALACATDAEAFCQEHRIILRQAEAQIIKGWALAETGDPDAGVPVLEAGLTLWQQLGANIYDSAWYSMLTRAYVRAGRLAEAREALGAAFKAANDHGEHVMLAELHRFDGQLHLASSTREGETIAEECFLKALDQARRQKARLYELRAAKCLAQLWMSKGKDQKAHDLLAPVYNWFTEGFDTKDLKEAKVLLEELEHAA
jgi:class 3 adenylate cyclase/predicted ATPase